MDLFTLVKKGKKFEKLLKNHCKKIEALRNIPKMRELCLLEIFYFETRTMIIWKSYVKSPYNFNFVMVKRKYHFCKNSWCVDYIYNEAEWKKEIVGTAFRY